MKYPSFDREHLRLLPLEERVHDLTLSVIRDLARVEVAHPELRDVANRIYAARERHAAVILMMGAHVLRSGAQRYLIDLMEKGLVDCLAFNGAGAIHDYEFARIGATTESVERYISEGQFGLWKETGELNDIINDGYRAGQGFGEAVGKRILEGEFPHKDISVFAQAYRLGIPATVHAGIGYDILHEHPNCDGAAVGAASYQDFLVFTKVVENLEGGVILNFGSAVMAPEVYLKALAMVRNAFAGTDKAPYRFTTLVCDVRELPRDYHQEPSRDHPAYYYRPLKTMLIRTVKDGGESFYVCGRHLDTVPQLWTALNDGANVV